MAKKPAEKKWCLYPGVGFTPDRDSHHKEWSPAQHWCVLMQSMHSGTAVYGPFDSEDAAHKWVREESDGEVYGNFNRTSVPGVFFHVTWMEIPTTRQ